MRTLSEIGMTKYLPYVVTKKSLKHYECKFSIDASKIELEVDGEWVPLSVANPRKQAVTYTVTVRGGKGSTSEVTVDRDNHTGRMKVNTHTVTFSNDTSSMRNLRANVGFLVFSTIAKALSEFVEAYPNEFQCFTFIPAHDKLTNVYEILARESEKQGFVIYVNRLSGKRMKRWYLLNTRLWDKYKRIKHID
jgi:hypothetical protein